MTATKQVALGTVVAFDAADGTSYATITLVIDAQPPSRKRVKIAQTALGDTLATYASGIEDFSEFSFTQYWQPGDTLHESIDTAFGAGSGTPSHWKITYPFGTPKNQDFHGWVSDLEPPNYTADGMITRKVTVQRTSAITVT